MVYKTRQQLNNYCTLLPYVYVSLIHPNILMGKAFKVLANLT